MIAWVETLSNIYIYLYMCGMANCVFSRVHVCEWTISEHNIAVAEFRKSNSSYFRPTKSESNWKIPSRFDVEHFDVVVMWVSARAQMSMFFFCCCCVSPEDLRCFFPWSSQWVIQWNSSLWTVILLFGKLTLNRKTNLLSVTVKRTKYSVCECPPQHYSENARMKSDRDMAKMWRNYIILN